MTVCMSKNFRSYLPLMEEEEVQRVAEKQGIVTILSSDCERTKAASLRRTLSADMSSKKWLAQNGFSPMKKIASSEELPIPTEDSSSSSSSSEVDEEDELKSPGQADVWMRMQSDQEKKKPKKPGQFDIWSSILCQKAKDTSKLPPPYVHPLVKRSSSSLSEKSLEICTESLGSETGSEGLSSFPSSEIGDMEEEKDKEVEQKAQEKEWQCLDNWDDFRAVNFSGKKSPPRSFPPTLSSLSHGDGQSLQMHPHRKNGRLVLEAVSVPSKNYFQAQREDGRLVLTIVSSPLPQLEPKEDVVQEFAIVFDNFEEVEEKENEGEKNNCEEEEEEEEDEEEGVVEKIEKENEMKDIRLVMKQEPKSASGVIKVHRSALMMKKLMGLDNRNTIWPHKFNKAVNLVEVGVEEEVERTPFPQSLPPGSRVARLLPSPPASTAAAAAAASSFNSYEYFWRTNPTVTISPISQQCQPLINNQNRAIISNTTPKAYQQQDLLVLKGDRADYLFPLLRGCKEPRRSLLFWEPYCIATS